MVFVYSEKGQNIFNSMFEPLPGSLKVIFIAIMYIVVISPPVIIFTSTMCDVWKNINEKPPSKWVKLEKILLKIGVSFILFLFYFIFIVGLFIFPSLS